MRDHDDIATRTQALADALSNQDLLLCDHVPKWFGPYNRHLGNGINAIDVGAAAKDAMNFVSSWRTVLLCDPSVAAIAHSLPPLPDHRGEPAMALT